MVLCRYRFGGHISLSALPQQLFPTLVENLTGFSFSVNRLVSKKCIHMSIYKTVKCWWAYILLFYCWRLFSLKVFVPVFVSGENVASTLPFDCELPADTFAQIYATRCKRQLHVLKIAATTKSAAQKKEISSCNQRCCCCCPALTCLLWLRLMAAWKCVAVATFVNTKILSFFRSLRGVVWCFCFCFGFLSSFINLRFVFICFGISLQISFVHPFCFLHAHTFTHTSSHTRMHMCMSSITRCRHKCNIKIQHSFFSFCLFVMWSTTKTITKTDKANSKTIFVYDAFFKPFLSFAGEVGKLQQFKCMRAYIVHM